MMKIMTVVRASVGFALALGLVGCTMKTKTESIQAWKADGKTGKIIKLLYDPQQATRLEALEALVEMKAPDALAPFGALFKDPDMIIVNAAVDGVAQIGGADAKSYLLQAIKLDSVPARITASTALGSYPSPEAVDALIPVLDDYRYEDLVLAAIKSLGEQGSPKAVEPLTKKLQERSYSIREACIRSLRQIGDDAAMQGIATRIGDVKDSIRGAVVDALLEHGEGTAPYVMEALRSENYLARTNAVVVLKGIGAIPKAGGDLVWYHLAELTGEKEPVVDPAKADVFTSIEDSIPALLEGVMHQTPAVREYAFIALENTGEAAVEPAMAMVEEKAGTEALKWFKNRSRWSGAPSWRLDLWAAATALNPHFRINLAYVDLLAKGGSKAEKVMLSEQFKPRREFIPYLLSQLSVRSSADLKKQQEGERCRSIAIKHIVSTKYQALLPLMAAMDASDPQIAVQAAKILNNKKDDRSVQMITAECTSRLEPPVPAESGGESGDVEPAAVATPNPAEELSGTSFHSALLELDIPALQPLVAKIRPDKAVAIKDFQKKYPKVKVISLPLNGGGATPTEVPFHLSYYKNGKMNDLMVAYRRNSDKNWTLYPPFPDTLP